MSRPMGYALNTLCSLRYCTSSRGCDASLLVQRRLAEPLWMLQRFRRSRADDRASPTALSGRSYHSLCRPLLHPPTDRNQPADRPPREIQAARDVERDMLSVNGVLVKGSEGYPVVVGKVKRELARLAEPVAGPDVVGGRGIGGGEGAEAPPAQAVGSRVSAQRAPAPSLPPVCDGSAGPAAASFCFLLSWPAQP